MSSASEPQFVLVFSHSRLHWKSTYSAFSNAQTNATGHLGTCQHMFQMCDLPTICNPSQTFSPDIVIKGYLGYDLWLTSISYDSSSSLPAPHLSARLRSCNFLFKSLRFPYMPWSATCLLALLLLYAFPQLHCFHPLLTLLTVSSSTHILGKK